MSLSFSRGRRKCARLFEEQKWHLVSLKYAYPIRIGLSIRHESGTIRICKYAERTKRIWHTRRHTIFPFFFVVFYLYGNVWYPASSRGEYSLLSFYCSCVCVCRGRGLIHVPVAPLRNEILLSSHLRSEWVWASATHPPTHSQTRREEGIDPLAVTVPTRSAKHQRHAPPICTGHHGRHGGPSVCAGRPFRGATRFTRSGERQTERRREMNERRQKALKINLARERAPTPPATRGSGPSSIHDAATKLHCSPALNGTRCLTLCDGRM
ncbi:hypothetical protein TCDM_12824 [Trypanosoma cruzi Dm28c]|uniref:Uncharacterized protein n=1 Tax=Trypanosoma cruzi Dm28c TaxID=1416333 RepID=V5APX8_TRYCR|nr:hypothetical protein TCDM_12824 [Trypanosoma cruzi Dm28c]